MNKLFFALLLFALAAYGQQERIAIIQTMDDRDSIGISELAYLTDRLRETAANVLPKQRYGVMTTESIVAFLGSQERAAKECREASCLAELGRKVSADYVAQARIGRFNKNLTIKTELYSSKSGVMLGSFTGDSKNISGLLAIINAKAPDLFKKMPGASPEKSQNNAFADSVPKKTIETSKPKLSEKTNAQNAKNLQAIINNINLTIENLQIYLDKEQAEKIKRHNDIFIKEIKSEYKQIYEQYDYWQEQFEKEKARASDSLEKLCQDYFDYRWQYLTKNGIWKDIPNNYTEKDITSRGWIAHFRVIAMDDSEFCLAATDWRNDSDSKDVLYPESLDGYEIDKESNDNWCGGKPLKSNSSCSPKGLRLYGYEKVSDLFPKLKDARKTYDKFSESEFRNKSSVLFKAYFNWDKINCVGEYTPTKYYNCQKTEDLNRLYFKLADQYKELLEHLK
jgi:hypothetical protein